MNKYCYFARPVTFYGTKFDEEAMLIIKARGWKLVDPSLEFHQKGYDVNGMSYFENLVKTCDAFVYLPFDDETISAGVAKEFRVAYWYGMPRFRINYSEGLLRMDDLPYSRVLTVAETRARIKEIRANRKKKS